MEGDGDGDTEGSDNSWSTALVVLACLITAITIFANLANLLMVMFRRVQKNSHNMLLGSLAAADLIMGLLGMPLKIAYHLDDTWGLNSTLCTWWLFSITVSYTASVLTLSAIALDRFWAVKDPLIYETLNRVPKIIGVIWFLASLLALMPLLKFHETEKNRCDVQQGAYLVTTSFLFVVVPMIFIFWCYISVYKEVYTKEKRSRKCSVSQKVEHRMSNMNGNELKSATVDFNNFEQKESPESQSAASLRHGYQVSVSTRIFAISVLITGVFVGCTTPIASWLIAREIGEERPDNWNYVRYILEWLKMLNSFFNPFIYTVFNAEFRNAYKYIFDRYS